MNALINFLGVAAAIIQIADATNVDVAFDLHRAMHIVAAATGLVKIYRATLALQKVQSNRGATKRVK